MGHRPPLWATRCRQQQCNHRKGEELAPLTTGSSPMLQGTPSLPLPDGSSMLPSAVFPNADHQAGVPCNVSSLSSSHTYTIMRTCLMLSLEGDGT